MIGANTIPNVYAAIAGHWPDGLPTFADGVRAAVLTTAVLRSAGSGQWVDVADGPDAAAASSSVSPHTGVTA